MEIKLTFSLLFIFLIFLGCDQNEHPCAPLNEKLPNKTTTGNNTFGFKSNGKNWVSHKTVPLIDFYGEVEISASLKKEKDQFTIIANRDISVEGCWSIDQRVTLIIDSLLAGIPEFSTNTSLIDLKENCSYKIDSSKFNQIEVLRLDTLNSILSCTFDLQFRSDNCSELILVSEGRFDLTYD